MANLIERMADCDVALHSYSQGGVDGAYGGDYQQCGQAYGQLTCHGHVGKGEQVGDRLGEYGPYVDGGQEEGGSKDYQGGDDVDQVVGAQEHHQAAVKTLFKCTCAWQILIPVKTHKRLLL